MMGLSVIALSIAMLLIAITSSEGAKLEHVDLRQESLKGCSMSSLNKCYGSIPPDGSRPNNLLEEIGQIADAQTCQSFCNELYNGVCTWFIFDRTTNDCKLFSGSLNDLRADCKEVGYAKEPDHNLCDDVFASDSENACYNFREDYCRFEFSLLENLENIESLSECQMACDYINNCTYFVYDNPTKICKLNTLASSRPVCDIIHGTPEPDFNTCVNDGHLEWASNETSVQAPPSSPNVATPEACENGDAKLEADGAPYIFWEGIWNRICGHNFWNNQEGAKAFCKQLGYTDGTFTKSGKHNEHQLRVGTCNAGEALASCTGGSNDYKINGDCKVNQDDNAITISCVGHNPGTEKKSCEKKPKNNWIMGEGGDICNDVCQRIGRTCNADEQTKIDSQELIQDVMTQMGITCKHFHTVSSDGKRGLPMYKAEHQECWYMKDGWTSTSCEFNQFQHHYPLCYCEE